MRTSDTFRLYLWDLVTLLKERARRAKSEGAPESGEAAAFRNGVVMGYYEVLSTMRSQAAAFEIPLEDLNLHDIDPDNELLRP